MDLSNGRDLLSVQIQIISKILLKICDDIFKSAGVIFGNKVLKNQNDGIGDEHFKIRYCPLVNKYFIRDLGQGGGTYLRVDAPTELHNGAVICIGHSYITVGILF